LTRYPLVYGKDDLVATCQPKASSSNDVSGSGSNPKSGLHGVIVADWRAKQARRGGKEKLVGVIKITPVEGKQVIKWVQTDAECPTIP